MALYDVVYKTELRINNYDNLAAERENVEYKTMLILSDNDKCTYPNTEEKIPLDHTTCVFSKHKVIV